MLLMYLYRLPLFMTLLILFLISDSYLNLYPLYQSLNEKNTMLRTLTQQYRQTLTTTAKKSLSSHPREPLNLLIPYHSNDWLSTLTKAMLSCSLQIKKLQMTAKNSSHPYEATEWQVLLSGNAEQLLQFFTIFYHDFPWLAIHEPLFTLNHESNLLDVSLQLIALTKRPTNSARYSLGNKRPLTILPFCQSNQSTHMQQRRAQKSMSFIRSKHRTVTF